MSTPYNEIDRYRKQDEDWWRKYNEIIQNKRPTYKGVAWEARRDGGKVCTKTWVIPYEMDGVKGKMHIVKYYDDRKDHVHSEKFFVPLRKKRK